MTENRNGIVGREGVKRIFAIPPPGYIFLIVLLLVITPVAMGDMNQDDRTVFTDASGDVFSVKEATSVIFGHFIDITRVERWVEDSQMHFEVTFGPGAVVILNPDTDSYPFSEYRLYIDVDGDQMADFICVAYAPQYVYNGYNTFLMRVKDNHAYYFNSTGNGTNTLHIAFPIEYLGTPSFVDFYVEARKSYSSDYAVDYCPDLGFGYNYKALPGEENPTDSSVRITIDDDVTYRVEVEEELDDTVHRGYTYITGSAEGADHVRICFEKHYSDGTVRVSGWIGEFDENKLDNWTRSMYGMEKYHFTFEDGRWEYLVKWELSEKEAPLSLRYKEDLKLKYVVIWVRAYSDEGESKWNQASIRLNMVETGRGGYEGVVGNGESGRRTLYFYAIIIEGILIVVAVIYAFIYKMRTKGKKENSGATTDESG